MPRLSLWRPEKSEDYRFIDNIVSESFTVGGTDVNIHKYIGPDTSNNNGSDPTQPAYATQSERNIQDLLWLENRDRMYDESIYKLRGIYNVHDIDFDLSQFGLYLQNDTLFIVFHINDMVNAIGRKLMNGDVLELPHMRDFFPLDTNIPASLMRFYGVRDGNRASEGFSQTWFPHLWRVKCTPIVDAQEYRGITNRIALKADGSEVDNTNYTADSTMVRADKTTVTADLGTNNKLRDLLSSYQESIEINKAIIEQAENNVPKSGYDTSSFYIVPTNPDGSPAVTGVDASSTEIDASSMLVTADSIPVTPSADPYQQHSYLTGDGLAPNGFPVTPASDWPTEPTVGQYVLRLDFRPNRLFRYDGSRWNKIEDNVRTPATSGKGTTQRERFTNNTSTYVDEKGVTRQSRQSLSKALRPEEDE